MAVELPRVRTHYVCTMPPLHAHQSWPVLTLRSAFLHPHKSHSGQSGLWPSAVESRADNLEEVGGARISIRRAANAGGRPDGALAREDAAKAPRRNLWRQIPVGR